MTQGTVVSRKPLKKKSSAEIGTSPEKLSARKKVEGKAEKSFDEVRQRTREFGESLSEQANLQSLMQIESSAGDIPLEYQSELDQNAAQIEAVKAKAQAEMDEICDRDAEEAELIRQEISQRKQTGLTPKEDPEKRFEEMESIRIDEQLKKQQEELAVSVAANLESQIKNYNLKGETQKTQELTVRLENEQKRQKAEQDLMGEIGTEVDLEILFGQADKDTPKADSERGTSKNEVFFVTMKNGEKGVLKPQIGENETLLRDVGFDESQKNLFRREWLAGQIDRVLGLDMIPATVVRNDKEGKHGVGSVQHWQEDDHQLKKDWENTANPAEIEKLALFDYITGNIDRHLGNFTMDETGKMMGIDNGLTFLPKEDLAPRSFAWDFVTREAVKQSGLTDAEDIYVKQASLPRTELSADLKQKLEAFFSEANYGVRRGLESAFASALDEREGQEHWQKFMDRARDLLDNGFPAYKYIEEPARNAGDDPQLESTEVGGPVTSVGGFESTNVAKIIE